MYVVSGPSDLGSRLCRMTVISGKREADQDITAAATKAKASKTQAVSSSDAGETKTIFVSKLSWDVDNDWLASEFAECGEVVSARVQVDRNTACSEASPT